MLWSLCWILLWTNLSAATFSPGPSGGTDNGIASCNSTSCYRYYSSRTKPYFIESFPDIPFATGEFYGGEVPINSSDPGRTLFFIFKPCQSGMTSNLTIWFNGGPGSSSLLGFLQENGPISWRPGTKEAVENPFAWSKLTNMLWVEQPVGTGFSKGKITATNEDDISRDFLGFFKNWQEIFGIQNYKIYVTGESYAGLYVPYVSAAMLNRNDPKHFNLKGAMVYDGCIGDCGNIQTYLPTYGFTATNNAILRANQSTLDKMAQISEEYGYTAYLDKYLQYPPPAQPPPPKGLPLGLYKLQSLLGEPFHHNPCFNQLHIVDTCPKLSDPLEDGEHAYFNRPHVKKAVHAPSDIRWRADNANVFINYTDTSPNAYISVLPQVIEATNRVLIGNGDWDTSVPINGTLLTIQNMTWHGHRGFQSGAFKDFIIPRIEGHRSQGLMGKTHFERGLMWAEINQCGHMVPQYQPKAAWLHMQWLLEIISEL